MLADMQTLLQDADAAEARYGAHQDNESARVAAGIETDLERYVGNREIRD